MPLGCRWGAAGVGQAGVCNARFVATDQEISRLAKLEIGVCPGGSLTLTVTVQSQLYSVQPISKYPERCGKDQARYLGYVCDTSQRPKLTVKPTLILFCRSGLDATILGSTCLSLSL